MNSYTEQFVSVPVPAEYVMDVMGYLASLREGEGVRVSTGTPETVPAPEAQVAADSEDKSSETLPSISWSVDDLARLASTSLFTTRQVALVLDVLAEKPGEWFTTTDLVNRIDIVRSNLKGVLSALTRHVRKHYARANWPMTAVWGPDIGDGFPGEVHYRFDDEDRAATWREARARGGGTSV